MSSPSRTEIVEALARRGLNAEAGAVRAIANASAPGDVIEEVATSLAPEEYKLRRRDVEAVLESANEDPVISSGSSPQTASSDRSTDIVAKPGSPNEIEGRSPSSGGRDTDARPTDITIANDVTGESTGTGTYDDFIAVFRDRYKRLRSMLNGRVTSRPIESITERAGGETVGIIGLITDIYSTRNGHWMVELEDTTGTIRCLFNKDNELTSVVDTLLFDEALAVEGTVANDGGVIFVDGYHQPDIPISYDPPRADRPVEVALISDVHVGSQEFDEAAWERFANWLHTPEAERIEYLCIAGDMVEGVGVYPDQDEELTIVDIFEQYEAFAEYLAAVPESLEIVMIPGNHDAVRLAEPQPGFDEQLRSILDVHDATIVGNPSTVTIEGVPILMYHGMSLDTVIAELPEEQASYDSPHLAMQHLLKKRHLAPAYGGRIRLAPEARDYLVIDEPPAIFHAGHVHKVGWDRYHNVLTVNTGCWQQQTAFQRSVNIDPDVGHAAIVDLQTLELTVRKFT